MFTDQAIQRNYSSPDVRSLPTRTAADMQPLQESARTNLTVREREVLELAGQGMSNKGIAQALGISPGTVTWHLKNCYQKYGVSTREQALKRARLHTQIRSVGTSVCACGRVHTLWEPVSAKESSAEAEQK